MQLNVVSCRLHIILVVFAMANSAPLAAFCADPANAQEPLLRWKVGKALSGTQIPIWVVTSGSRAVDDDPAKVFTTGTDLPQATVIEAVKRAARSLSETPANVSLYFAGTIGTDSVPREGIQVQSSDIIGQANSQVLVAINATSSGSRINLHGISPGDPFKWSADPSADGIDTLYLTSVLLHEMLHSLSLNHMHDPCAPANFTNDPLHCSQSGCTSLRRSAMADSLDYPTADDISGIQYSFGSRLRSLAVYESTDGVSWQAGSSIPSYVKTRVPPAISGLGVSNPAVRSVVAYADELYRPTVLIDTGSGYGPPSTVGGSLAVNFTMRRMSVAVRGDEIAVAWFDEEDQELRPRRRVSVRAANGTWSEPYALSSNEGGRFPNMEIALDPTAGKYLLVSRTNTSNFGAATILAPPSAVGVQNILNFGIPGIGTGWPHRNLTKPACSVQLANCVIAAASSPTYEWSFHHISISNSSNVDDSRDLASSALDPMGMNDLAINKDGVVVATYSHSSQNAYVGRRASLSSPFTVEATHVSNFWPIAVGIEAHRDQLGPSLFIDRNTFRVVVAP